jgi:4-hydroxy-tetrahydrodipicolinate synthase
LFFEVNPIPVKYAVSLLGFCDGSVRLPLTEATPEARKAVEAAMQYAGVLG